MEKTKKNNKGFSLVELIVVVLIMAIIAVSLAPQVMKWVDRSRQANDASNYEALVSAAQLSILAVKSAEDAVITMDKDGTSDDSSASTEFVAAMNSNLPGWTSLKVTSTTNAAATYKITISNSQVIRGSLDGSGNIEKNADGTLKNVPGEIAAN